MLRWKDASRGVDEEQNNFIWTLCGAYWHMFAWKDRERKIAAFFYVLNTTNLTNFAQKHI